MCVRRIHITMHSDDQKLAGFQSVSTSVVINPICQARRMVNSTCAKCYAESILRYRKNLDAFLVENFDILNSVMSDEEINAVQFSTVYARIESFGDSASQLNLTTIRGLSAPMVTLISVFGPKTMRIGSAYLMPLASLRIALLSCHPRT